MLEEALAIEETHLRMKMVGNSVSSLA